MLRLRLTIVTLLPMLLILLTIISCNDKTTQPKSQLKSPVFDPEPGNYVDSVLVSLLCENGNADIYYSIDGEKPTEKSFLYNDPIFIDSTQVISARSFKKGWIPSNISKGVYSVEQSEEEKVSKPNFYPPPGRYEEVLEIEILTSTPDVQIHYTTTGAEPTEESPIYTEPVAITSITTLRAKAFKPDIKPSETAIGIFELKLALPRFDPPYGVYDEAQTVEITHDTENVNIHYTLNGDEPTFASNQYTDPILVPVDKTIKAIAFKSSWLPSEIVQATYIIDYADIPGMIMMPPGLFRMGDSNDTGRFHEKPVHNVSLNGFYIGQYQVTQEEWVAVMGDNPSSFNNNNNLPVDGVTWYWALVYCNRRSKLENLTPVYKIKDSTDPDDWGDPPFMTNDRYWNMVEANWEADGYRLPTEAEWEYAARSGTNVPDFEYTGSDKISDVAWYSDNSGERTNQVGLKLPNGAGVFDMSGNVWEWCWDWYCEDYYKNSPENNPRGPDTGSFRIIRGGSWAHSAANHRVASRLNAFPYRGNSFMGLRVVRNIQ